MSFHLLYALPSNQTLPTVNVEFQPSTWVKLRELPSPFSYDEALLLCEAGNGSWIAWIPEYGEIQLFPGQFY